MCIYRYIYVYIYIVYEKYTRSSLTKEYYIGLYEEYTKVFSVGGICIY